MNGVRSRPAQAAWWVAGGLLVASLVLLAYLYGRSLLYTGSIISGGATNGIALVALGVAIVAGAVIATARRARVRTAPVLVFALLAAGILVVGGVYFRGDARRYRSEIERQLSIVAELKSSELAQWRLERLGDASIFLGNAPFAAAVRRWFDHPQDAEAQADLRSWLTRVQMHYLYDRVSLIDARGIERLAVPERAPVASVVAPSVPAIPRSGAVTFVDFYRDEHDGRVYLAVLAPIFDERGRALCAVVLRVNPETYLYPLIRRWPTPAQTAETLLVRREGADIVFLNEPKFQKGTALTLRRPLVDPDLPAAMAVRGQEGVVEGTDYRGIPVIAALRAVPNSPWFLVARIDAAEADAPLRERLWVILALVGGLLAAAAGGVGVAWREQRVRELKGRYEGEKERAWLHDVVARSLNEVYVFDPETLRFRFVNRGACRNVGYTEEELAGLTPLDLKPEFTAETFRAMLEPLRGTDRPVHVYETVHRRKDGSEYPVEGHVQLVESGAGAVYLCIVNDITERRQADTQIRRLNRVYAVLSDVNQAIVRVRDRQALFEEVCRIAVETGGFKMAWVGLWDAPANSVRPVAQAGAMDGYLEKLRVDSGDGPRGSGPTGIAVLEGRHVVSNDIEHDPRMAPWREDALALGYRSSVAFPLRVNGKLAGAFNLYAAERDFFDEKELQLLDKMAMDLSFAMEMGHTEEARLRLATAVEQSPVSVVITDLAGRIEYVNPAFTRITGYTPEETLGGNARMLKSGKQEPALYEEMWATIKAGKSWHGELVNQRKDGTLYTLELTVAPVHEASGVTRFVAIGQDVTERRQAEEGLRASVREKAALLKEVHHRVKNNLQVITSLLRLESHRIDHTATRAVLKDMQNRIQSMAVLHETLYRSGNFAEVDLGAYLRQLTGQLIRSIVATPGQIELRLDLASVGLNLDQAIPCGLIVNELLSNSLKHGFPAGRSGEVRVELHRVGDEGLRLRLSDNGVGLPPDFETKRKASLGLQLVSDLARQLNGGLVIHQGAGASFEVTFIRADSERI